MKNVKVEIRLILNEESFQYPLIQYNDLNAACILVTLGRHTVDEFYLHHTRL